MNATLSEDTKNPKLLPRREWFTVLLIREVHQQLVHAGVSHTLSQLRVDFPGSSPSEECYIKVCDMSKV